MLSSTTRASSCKNCGARPTVRSHLMPRALSHMVRGDDKGFSLVTKEGARHRLMQASIFDDSILCVECENALGRLDNYAAQFCRRCDDLPQKIRGHFLARDVSTDMLARFAASIVWRCGVSTRPELAKVSLSEDQEARLRTAAFVAGRPPVLYPLLSMARYAAKRLKYAECFMTLPAPCEWFGAHYAFCAGGFRWLIRVDAGGWPTNRMPSPINGLSYVSAQQIVLEESEEFAQLVPLLRKIRRRLERQGYRNPYG